MVFNFFIFNTQVNDIAVTRLAIIIVTQVGHRELGKKNHIGIGIIKTKILQNE